MASRMPSTSYAPCACASTVQCYCTQQALEYRRRHDGIGERLCPSPGAEAHRRGLESAAHTNAACIDIESPLHINFDTIMVFEDTSSCIDERYDLGMTSAFPYASTTGGGGLVQGFGPRRPGVVGRLTSGTRRERQSQYFNQR